jgi:uncharacterized membrane protein YagU involved in acid resistance
VNWASWLVWGFAGTVVLTTIMSSSQVLGLTRMSLPYMLGTIFTPNRDRAKVYGIALHMLNGWIFSLVYVATFHVSGRFSWWFGAAIGFVHGAFVVAVAMPALPGMHPRMASDVSGPSVVGQLEPPGPLGRNYGIQTPLVALLAHVVFGIVLGAFYAPR